MKLRQRSFRVAGVRGWPGAPSWATGLPDADPAPRGAKADQDFANARANGITAARLGLALTVVVSHSFTFTGGMTEPLVAETGQVSLGFVAVLGFFGLSGYLLAGSRGRSSRARFLWNRAVRILPGYWLALVFGACAATIGASLVGSQIGASDLIRYVLWNVALIPAVESIGPAFGGSAINGALWTLGIEVLCYVVLVLTPVRWLRPVTVGLIPALIGVYAVRGGLELQLVLAFLAGSGAYLFRLPITVTGSMVAGVLAAVLYAQQMSPLAGMAVALACLGLTKLPLRWERDLSYGVYVLSCPLQQVLALTVIATWGVGAMAVATIVLVLPMSWVSWTVVERRALRSRSRHRLAVGSVSERWRNGSSAMPRLRCSSSRVPVLTTVGSGSLPVQASGRGRRGLDALAYARRARQ